MMSPSYKRQLRRKLLGQAALAVYLGFAGQFDYRLGWHANCGGRTGFKAGHSKIGSDGA